MATATAENDAFEGRESEGPAAEGEERRQEVGAGPKCESKTFIVSIIFGRLRFHPGLRGTLFKKIEFLQIMMLARTHPL